MRRFELSDGKSDKFWEVSIEGTSFTVRYGRIGTNGQTQAKSFATEQKARAEADKLIEEKKSKGYVEVAAVAAAAPAQAAPVNPAKATNAGSPTSVAEAPPPEPRADAAVVTKAPVVNAAAAKGSGNEADLAALPRVLRSPPWLSKEKRPAPKSVEVATLARPHAFAWKPGELEKYSYHYKPTKPESAAILADMTAKVAERGENVSPWIDSWWCLMRLIDEDVKTAWDAFPLVVWRANSALYVLARLGDACLPKYIEYAVSLRQPTTSSALAPLVSPEVAVIMGDGFAGRRSRADAEAWLRAHPEMAAVGLIPVAIGKSKARENAGAALRFLVGRGHGDVIREVARAYGPAAEEALAEVLAKDPADSFPAKIPALPAFFAAESLPRPRLLNGDALPVSAVGHLATMLAFSNPEAPYGGLAQVKEACDADSLDAFAWALFEAWSKAGSPPKEQWALFALGFLGGDASARKLTPLIRAWPGEGLHARAVLGLDVLAMIGSDIALMNLHGIAEKVKFKGLQERAREKVAAIAENRGLTVDELADRIAPDLDLDADGSKVLNFGARTFRVGFDEALRPYVRDASGAKLAELPKPNKSDDSALASAAVDAWKLLKKDAKQVASGQIFRLEKAMCAERKWDLATFEACLVKHPLIQHLTRMLLWGTYDGEGRLGATFRVAEDGSFADEDDRAVKLAGDVVVGLPHALRLDARAITTWGQRFADYMIVPPFPQLVRDTYAPTAEEARSMSIERVSGWTVPTGKVIGLLSRGWQKGPPQDAGWIWEWQKPLAGSDGHASLRLDTGVLASGMTEEPEQKLGDVSLPVAAGALSPVVFSELVRDLMSLK